MPKISNIKLNKGGEMTILPVRTNPNIKLARLQGGKVPSKKHRGNLVKEVEEPRKQRRQPKNEQEAVGGMSGRELQLYLNMKNKEGRLQRETLGSTRDVLLQEILGTMEGQRGSGMNLNEDHSSSKKESKGSGMRTPIMIGGDIKTGMMLGGNLDKLVKNDMRLKHLRDMGVRLENYSPYLIKAVVDGDYRSFRTTNEKEWKELVTECAIRGVQVNIMGRKTEFGKNLDGFLRNGTMGGMKIDTDDMINIDLDQGKPNVNRVGLQGGSMTNVNAMKRKQSKPSKDSMIAEVLSMAINVGQNPAIDLLNSFKSSLTKDEYADLYVYLGQNSLPLV